MVKWMSQRALLLAALLATLAGCGLTTSSFAPHREIEAIGVAASQKVAVVGSNTEYTYTFDDGRIYTLTIQGHVLVGGPSPGDLLIAGSKPKPWTLVASPQGAGWPKGCYLATDHAIEEHDTTVDLDIGVTLQKSPDFEPNGLPAAHGIRVEMCLDRQGRVMRIYVGGA